MKCDSGQHEVYEDELEYHWYKTITMILYFSWMDQQPTKVMDKEQSASYQKLAKKIQPSKSAGNTFVNRYVHTFYWWVGGAKNGDARTDDDIAEMLLK